MNGRRSATGLLVVALFALCPIAHASPIGPTWIAGFWDDGDHDGVVILVTSMATAADMNLVATLKPQSLRARTSSPTASRDPPVHA
jgi:hypothetical protein